jgi:hypothetical protein
MTHRPQTQSTSMNKHLSGDLTPASSTNDFLPDSATFLPGFGEIAEVGDGYLTDQSGVYLSHVGDLAKKAEMVLAPLQTVGDASLMASRPSKPGNSTGANARALLSSRVTGALQARNVLARAGAGSKQEQDALLSAGATAADLAELGNMMRGKIPGNKLVPFFSLAEGNLTGVRTLRTNAGAKVRSLAWQMIRQENVFPFKYFVRSLTPISGTPVFMTSVLPVGQRVPVTYLKVKLSSPYLTANRTTVFTIALVLGAGGVVTKTVYSADVSYSEDGIITAMFLIGNQVDGDWFIQEQDALNDAVPANTIDVGFIFTGVDGATDRATIELLGPGHEYVAELSNLLQLN